MIRQERQHDSACAVRPGSWLSYFETKVCLNALVAALIASRLYAVRATCSQQRNPSSKVRVS